MNKIRKKTVLILTLCLCMVCLGSFLFYKQLTKVTQVFEEKTFELGQAVIDTELENYIETSKYMYGKSSLDISDVKEDAVGDYTIVCTVKEDQYLYTIHIVDTTAPSFSFTEEDSLYGTDNVYPMDDVLATAKIDDLSKLNEVELVSCKDEAGNDVSVNEDVFLFDQTGTYTFEFEVADVYGNSARASKSIEVLESPHFVLLSDRQYKIGAPFDVLDLVYAFDRNGNDITDSIQVENADDFATDNVGEYQITYSVQDEDGLPRKETVQIRVGAYVKNKFGFENNPENMQLLIDHDFFKYEALVDNTDTDTAVELTKYAGFGIKDDTGWGAESFLYKVTPNYLYFVTNKHCSTITEKDLLCFVDYDDNIINTAKDTRTTYDCSDNDLEIVKVPISCFDLSELLTYKEALVDWDVYDSMNVGETLIVNSQAFGYKGFDSLKDKIDEGKIRSFEMDSIDGHPFWSGYTMLTTFGRICVGGQSGSPAYNLNGVLIGVENSGHIDRSKPENNSNGFVPLRFLKAFSETIDFE